MICSVCGNTKSLRVVVEANQLKKIYYHPFARPLVDRLSEAVRLPRDLTWPHDLQQMAQVHVSDSAFVSKQPFTKDTSDF